jgi:hypothetical protein
MKLLASWLCLMLHLMVSIPSSAQSTAPYELINGTFDSNNILSASGYEVVTSNNLPGANEIISGDYALSGGLSGSAITAPVAAGCKIYLPVITR